ncbi:DegT/DnrJ/EryC1/StrS family aminotransferase [Streptomyces sedi]|uniref:Aminotransferase class I/II-fold pyridoxal phosphate-dependent enzyme n=1 Tax=Streptomyces sedi TaxID=555059 RepID=A0A5C4VE83_9ACTN|nr:DegT/DnrJ/EryC1/StrS family aminotransferase [Streptomyces sedi]TNM34193.1 aminotransferase class I/II-fold pyridoxal phosphate-dependent enzyme [Streptomyces sedi]
MPQLPAFREPLHVGRPNIGDRDRLRERIDAALDRRWLSSGPLVRELEERVAALAGTRHAVATCNATIGLQLAARAVGIEPGAEVIVPAFTWVATPHALGWIGITPVFCDVDEETGNIDPAHAEKLIGPATGGILGVHVFGRPCPVDELTALAEHRGVPLFFDAAHGLGSTYRGRPVGGFGAAEVFSFHATKFINSFEGGAVVTDDPETAARARAMRNFGIQDDGQVGTAGTNAKLSEASAAMGLTSLESMDDLMAHNLANQRAYEDGLGDLPGVTVRRQEPGERANHQYVVIEIDEAVAGVHRDRVHAVLSERNVLSRRYFHPSCHQVEPYRSSPGTHAPLPLPHAEALSERVLSLPTGSAVDATDIAGVCDIVRWAVQNRG